MQFSNIFRCDQSFWAVISLAYYSFSTSFHTFIPVVFIIFLWMSCSSCQQVSEFLWLTSFRHNNCSSFRACGIQTGSLPFLLCSSINLMGHYRWSWWCRSFNVPPRLHPSTLLLFFFPQYSAQYHTSIISQCIHLFLLCLFFQFISTVYLHNDGYP